MTESRKMFLEIFGDNQRVRENLRIMFWGAVEDVIDNRPEDWKRALHSPDWQDMQRAVTYLDPFREHMCIVASYTELSQHLERWKRPHEDDLAEIIKEQTRPRWIAHKERLAKEAAAAANRRKWAEKNETKDRKKAGK